MVEPWLNAGGLQAGSAMVESFAAEHVYQLYDLGPAVLVASDPIVETQTQRDYLFLCRPDAHRWLESLDMV
ncbi:MAG: hypothetical protein WCN21_15010 [Comamonadaceae bacterium]